MSTQIDAVTDSVRQHIAGYRPASGQDLHSFFNSLPDLFREMGSAFAQCAEGMTDEHIAPAVMDALREMGSVVGGMADHAENVLGEHNSAHDLWLRDH
jgi:hypothetical protein